MSEGVVERDESPSSDRCGFVVGDLLNGGSMCHAPIRAVTGERPVIFLDIDGVLNRATTESRIGPYVGLDSELVRRFKRLLRVTGAEVVLSSTWRTDAQLLDAIDREVVLRDRTGPMTGSRGSEILRWLEDHPEVTRHAVIDDDRDMVAGLVPFFTESRTGLTDEVIADLIAYLGPGYEHIDPDGVCVECGRERSGHGDARSASTHVYREPTIDLGHDALPQG